MLAAAAARAGGAALRRVGARGLHWSATAASAAEPAHSHSHPLSANEDFDLTEDQRQFQHVAETFAREELAPYRQVTKRCSVPLLPVAPLLNRPTRTGLQLAPRCCAALTGMRSTTFP